MCSHCSFLSIQISLTKKTTQILKATFVWNSNMTDEQILSRKADFEHQEVDQTLNMTFF